MTLGAAHLLGASSRNVAVSRVSAFAPAVLAFGPIFGLAAAQGGFFPSSWGWASLPLLWAAVLALALRQQIRLSGPERTFIGLLAGLSLWILASAVWSVAPADTILEAQRGLVYFAGVAAVLVVARSRFVWEILGGLLAAISTIAMFSLATRVLPDRVGVSDRTVVSRLSQPIGYWNGLAVFACMGALLALGFAARGRTVVARAAAAAVLVVLLPTFYFTFGRAAWIALAVGLLVATALDPRRLQLLATLLVLGPAPALAIWVASEKPGLTRVGASFESAVHDGHRLALLLLILAALNAALVIALSFAERRVEPGPLARRTFATALVVAAAGTLGMVFARYGGPVTLAQKGYTAFKSSPPHEAVNLNRRLLNFSGNGRADLWRLAWDDAQKHPALGAGAGTYERYFLAYQPAAVSRVRDAHGLYIETLAELGPLGLALLLATLLVPFAVVGSARRHPLIPAAAGAYAAYLTHAGVDWDWELPAVTLAGLLCAATLLLAGRSSSRSPALSSRARWSGVALLVLVSISAAIGLVGSMALSRSDAGRRDQNWARAAAEARLARSWMPWSPAPWDAIGRAQLGAGLVDDARASFRKAISMDGGDWELWYRLASASNGRTRRDALRHATHLFPRARFLSVPSGKDGATP